jgi:CheY-like chemotaxis protein
MRALKVLVVDDDEIICTLLEDILTRQGHQVTTRTAPRLGLAAARNQDFDLALLDIQMAGMDGVELLEAMRPLQPKSRFVMITASPEDDRVGDALESGAGLCLSKPFDSVTVDELVGTLFR